MTTAVTPNSRKIRKIRPLKEKYGKNYGKKIGFVDVFDVFRRFLHVSEVLEAREALQKLPGGDTLRFHRI